jgi:hypothetical protein
VAAVAALQVLALVVEAAMELSIFTTKDYECLVVLGYIKEY